MRFLVDENLSPGICALLIAAGQHATHVRDEGLAGTTDQEVFATAGTGGLVVLTADRGDVDSLLSLNPPTSIG